MSILAFIGLLMAVIAGVLVIKRFDQKDRDRNRRTYRLSFPQGLDADSVTTWIRSITGTLRTSRTRLFGTPTVAFELWATSAGIQHRLKVPWQHADYVVAQLRSLVPGIRVAPEDDFPEARTWTRAAEVGLTHTSRPLRIFNAATTSASLLAAVQALEEDEAVLMQWVVSPAIPQHKPVYKEAKSHHLTPKMFVNGTMANRDEVNERRDKLGEPNVMAVLRVGAVAKTNVRADHLVYRVRASLSSTRSAATRFRKRLVPMDVLQKRLDLSAAPLNFPMQLSSSELAALIAWPIGNPFVSGLPPAMSRHLPATDIVPRAGIIIGRSNFPGNERTIAVSFEDARKHIHVVGPTGVGKTVLLGNMLRQVIEQNYGVVLIENKGDLFHAALDSIPPHRVKDVVVLDVNDTKWPVGFNILHQGDPRVVVDELGALFEYLYADTRKSVWTREVLYHGLRTLVTDPRYTFIDLDPLLVPRTTEEIQWRDSMLRSLKDRELRMFWQRFDNQDRKAQDRITQPVMDRIWQLNARPEIRNIIGQSESAFRMPDIVRDNKILLVNLAGLPKDTSALTGTLMVNALWHAAKTTKAAKPTYLFMDEFQDFTKLPVDPEDMLAKARGFGLSMTLAHQHLEQLPKDMRQAVSANARTKVVFQTSNDDARVMSREFGSTVEDHDFMNLGRYEALAKVSTGDGVSPPLTLTTLEAARPYNTRAEVVRSSRERHAKAASEVEKQITDRRKPEQVPKTRRPEIGSDKSWGKDVA